MPWVPQPHMAGQAGQVSTHSIAMAAAHRRLRTHTHTRGTCTRTIIDNYCIDNGEVLREMSGTWAVLGHLARSIERIEQIWFYLSSFRKHNPNNSC